jgi:heme oxygenase
MTGDETRPSLSAAFRQRTRLLHANAERSGVVRQILSGQASRWGYSLFLRNLLPVYQEMEARLEQRRHAPAFRDLARPEIYRTMSIIADLTALCGPNWSHSLPILPVAELYAEQVAAQGDGFGLLAHVYVRYLGDLNGGRVLKNLLARSLGLEPEALSFYEFPGIANLETFRIGYRAAIDLSASEIPDTNPVIEESAEAFQLNIRLSEAVQRAASPDSDAALAAEPALPAIGRF